MGQTWVLTGPIGCGKSTVAEMLRDCGATCFDADAMSNRILARHEDVHKGLTNMFGREVFGEDGKPRRDFIADRIFKRPALRNDLESLLHPYVFAELRDASEAWHKRNQGVVFMEVVLWFQQKNEPFPVDGVLLLWARQETLVERVALRNGLPEEKVLERLKAQGEWDNFTGRADRILNTDCDLDTLRGRVQSVYRGLVVD